MTFGGWICMIVAVSVVTGLFGWCCYKVLVTPEGGALHATSETLSEDWRRELKKRRRARRKRLNALKTLSHK